MQSLTGNGKSELVYGCSARYNSLFVDCIWEKFDDVKRQSDATIYVVEDESREFYEHQIGCTYYGEPNAADTAIEHLSRSFAKLINSTK